jgi:hypothetical protein
MAAMGLVDRLRNALSRPGPPAQALTPDEEEARRQADLLERDFRDRGPGRWRKVSTLWRRD